VVRALVASGPASIKAIAAQAGVTHSAASQTVLQMAKDGLVELRPGDDARERIVALTPRARRMLPALERQWAATNAAARELEGELSVPLSALLRETLEALERRSFADRIAAAAAAHEQSTDVDLRPQGPARERRTRHGKLR
jgi:DNA-binding MarR family transcriptional regulator